MRGWGRSGEGTYRPLVNVGDRRAGGAGDVDVDDIERGGHVNNNTVVFNGRSHDGEDCSSHSHEGGEKKGKHHCG